MNTIDNEFLLVTEESFFDGGLLQLLGLRLLGLILFAATLGLAAPWIFAMNYRWEAKHTVLDGRRLEFDGTGGQLFGNWIKWWFLTILTVGIFSFWIPIKIREWKTKHTHLKR